MLIKRIDGLLDVEKFQEDLRKLGVNFITAGASALFVAHSAGLSPWLIITSSCVIMGGILSVFVGLLRRNNNE